MSKQNKTGTVRLVHLGAWAIFAFLTPCVFSQSQPEDLTDESIEDLMSIQVTSVSKTNQIFAQLPSAVFVITPDAIRRSGANNIPDLLRMVPGLNVAQINSSNWAVSARGFNARFSNELLVLLDGRSVYTLTSGGVYWDTLDLPLSNVERIEVIRGPGGSVWGANAVNGVINVITRRSAETRGALLVGAGGNVDQGIGTAQYGGSAVWKTDYRLFLKYLNQGQFPALNGGGGADGWRLFRAGVRSDTSLSSKDTLMLQGDLYAGREGPAFSVDQSIPRLINLSGGFAQAVWNRSLSPRSSTTLQFYYDTYERNDQLREGRWTAGAEFSQNYTGLTRQNIVWGAEYRESEIHSAGDLGISLVPAQGNTQRASPAIAHVRNVAGVSLVPARRNVKLFSAFLQDEFAVVPSRFSLIAGAKVEHNDYSGIAFMPSGRAVWTPGNSVAMWAAVSRTQRSPDDLDTGLRAVASEDTGSGGLPVVTVVFGNPKLKNEGSIAYEAGYRRIIVPQLSFDLAGFYSKYDHQQTSEPGTPFLNNSPQTSLIVPLVNGNLMHGESHGAEVFANWQPAARWTLSPGYAFEKIHMHLAPTSQDTSSVAGAEGSTPVNAAQLRSHLALTRGLAWDASAYFVGRLTNPAEASYTRLDTGLSWEFLEGIDLSLVGQNLLRDRHQEFFDDTLSVQTTQVKRSAFAKLQWRF